MVFQISFSVKQTLEHTATELEIKHYEAARETAMENMKYFGAAMNDLFPKSDNQLWKEAILTLSTLFKKTEKHFENELASLRVLQDEEKITAKEFQISEEVCVKKYRREFEKIFEKLKANCEQFCPGQNITIPNPKRITHAQLNYRH